jgi:hypothetical protein
VKRQRTITYWIFVIDIVGPRYGRKSQRQAIHRVLSRKRLRDIEQAALLATKAKLPAGFSAIVS